MTPMFHRLCATIRLRHLLVNKAAKCSNTPVLGILSKGPLIVFRLPLIAYHTTLMSIYAQQPRLSSSMLGSEALSCLQGLTLMPLTGKIGTHLVFVQYHCQAHVPNPKPHGNLDIHGLLTRVISLRLTRTYIVLEMMKGMAHCIINPFDQFLHFYLLVAILSTYCNLIYCISYSRPISFYAGHSSNT